jgi:hypothetical protein
MGWNHGLISSERKVRHVFYGLRKVADHEVRSKWAFNDSGCQA